MKIQLDIVSFQGLYEETGPHGPQKERLIPVDIVDLLGFFHEHCVGRFFHIAFLQPEEKEPLEEYVKILGGLKGPLYAHAKDIRTLQDATLLMDVISIFQESNYIFSLSAAKEEEEAEMEFHIYVPIYEDALLDEEAKNEKVENIVRLFEKPDGLGREEP